MTAINSNRAIRGPVTAVPVVAGKGVRLREDIENNRWVVEADETVLFDDTTYIGTAQIGEYTLSEAAEHFERIRIYFTRGQSFYGDIVLEFNPNSGYPKMASLPCYDSNGLNMYTYFCSFTLSSSKFTELTGKCGYFQVINGTSVGGQVNKTSNWLHPYKIIGIHRIASN